MDIQNNENNGLLDNECAGQREDAGSEYKCSICNNPVGDNAAILTLSGMGYPRYVCSDCDALLENISTGSDVDEISRSIDSISTKLANNARGMKDRIACETVGQIIRNGTERAEMIRNGTYDFAADEDAEEFELTEDMLENDEDRLQTQQEQRRNTRMDKVMDVIFIISLIIAVACAVYFFIIK